MHPPIQFLLKQAIKDRALRELDRGMLRLWWSCPDRGQVPVMFSVWGLCSIEVIFFSKRSKRYVHFLKTALRQDFGKDHRACALTGGL